MFTLQQIRPVLKALGKTGAILIGGQAVNLWSERLQRLGEAPWKDSQPFTSVDVDLLGNQADVRILGVDLDAEIEWPTDPAHTPNIAKVHCPHPEIDIDILHTANGLNTADALHTAVRLKHGDILLQDLHPVLCVEAKTANLLTLDQQVVGRQDEKHLRLSIANCREYLSAPSGGRAAEVLLAWATRLRAHANTHAGLEIQRRYKLRFLDAVPVEKWRLGQPPLSNWAETEAPAWTQEVQDKLAMTEDIKDWVKGLQSKSKPPRSSS
jgi:hypothetical protein